MIGVLGELVEIFAPVHLERSQTKREHSIMLFAVMLNAREIYGPVLMENPIDYG